MNDNILGHIAQPYIYMYVIYIIYNIFFYIWHKVNACDFSSNEQSIASALFVCFCYGSFSLRLVFGYICVAVLQHSQPVMTSHPLSNHGASWGQTHPCSASIIKVFLRKWTQNVCVWYPMCFSCSWHYQVLFSISGIWAPAKRNRNVSDFDQYG